MLGCQKWTAWHYWGISSGAGHAILLKLADEEQNRGENQKKEQLFRDLTG
jgi:hypothetical protein